MPVPAEPLPDAGFDVVRRGYDPGQVDTHLRRIDAEIAILAADRTAAVDQAAQLGRELEDARDRSEKLRAQVRTLAGPPQSVQGMSERMRSMLRLAQDEVADMLGRAETEAAKRTQESEQQAAQVLATAHEEAAAFLGPAREEATELAERTVRERAQIANDRIVMERKLAADRAVMEQEMAELRAEAEQQLAAERAEVEQDLAARRTAVEQDLAARRSAVEQDLAETTRRATQEHATVEEDFGIAMDQRRSESLAALHTERVAARREIEESRRAGESAAREHVARAEAEARRMITDAERRVAELTALRGRIADQLGGARNAVGRVLTSLEPVPGEPTSTNGYTAEPPTVQLNPDTLTDAQPVPSPTPRQRTRTTSGRR